MSLQPLMIDLGDYRTQGSTVYAGRGRGSAVRKALNLDSLDTKIQIRIFHIPEDTVSVNASFFLGLFEPSIKALGEKAFRERYMFQGRDISLTVDNCIRETLFKLRS